MSTMPSGVSPISRSVCSTALFSERGDRRLVAVLGDGEVVGYTVLRSFEAGPRTIGAWPDRSE